MSIRRLSSYAFLVFLAVSVVWIVAGSRLSSQGVPQAPSVISGRNVNMVSGLTLPGGDPWLQRQNEPSIAVSSRNPLHLLAGANDYRTVDMPTSEGELPGKQPTAAVGDAWLGVFTSYDGGESWTSTMLPGFPQDSGNNPLKGYRAAADPVVRSGPNGLFYFSGIAFNRDTNLGVVFVARFIDDNNKENGGTIRYIDTKIIAKGTATKFLDKPWISVDQPRVPLTNITISGQTFPRHNVYIAYSSFSGTTTLLGDVMFARSTDCGTSWGTPIKLSTGSYAQQGATIAVKPVIGEIVVAWRRFGVSGRTPDTIYVAQSFSRGASFQSPVKVADVTPFDQPTTDETQALPGTAAGPAFRTNSYPTIAVDKSGHVYLAWSQRGQGPSGDARIVLSASYLGTNWSVPQPVANVDENGLPLLGHQIMPSMTFAAGKLALVWVDQRHDISALQYGFNKWIIDSLFSAPYLNLRHTMDVWAAEAETSTFPNLVWKSSQVSRYLHALLRDQFGEIVYQDGLPVVFPVQFNCVNYPLFKGGHNPFNGDYIDIAASPSFRQDTWRNWIFNTDDQRDPVFHVAWADNRDVRPPLNGNWTVYAPPASSQASAYVSPEHPSCNPNGSGNEPGMRNQNIYTSRLTWGVVAGAPVNDKPLNLANGVARAFVVYVQNNTETLRHFRLSIAAQPAAGQASFDQFSLLSSLDVDIAPYSTISRTVFIRSSDVNALVTVNVNEIDASGAIIADGLTSFVDINRDTSNPQMTGNQETHNPNIVNSANPNIVNWFINPNIVNPNIVNPNIVNPNIVNPNIVNPNIVNPNIVNPNIVNPNIVNPNIVNPNIVNPNIVNPNIVNPNIVNPNIVNPNIVNANPDDVTATDVEWTVKNDGTATTSYSLKTLAKKSPPQGVYVQLLVYRVHYTPAVTGAELKAEGVEACSLKQEPHHELVLNVVNPNIVNPNIVNPNIVNPNIVNADIENATFSVAPGEEVVIDLRVLDSGTSNVASSPQMAMGAMAAGVSTQAVTVDEFIQSLGFAVTSHAVNSVDVALGSQVPPADATDLVIGTASLPDGVVGYSYNAPLNAYGGAGSYAWSLNAGELPPGLSVAAGGAIVGTPTQAGTYQFIVRVDSGGQFDTQQYAVNIDSNTTPDPLNITTTSIPSGVQGVWYGATLQAVGGVWPRSWRLSSGALPEGVSLDSGGVISGTPTVTGSFGFTARVADRNGTIDTQTLTLVVAPETATYFDITGVVFNEGGAPLGGVVLRGLPNTPVTAADGTYADEVPAGWSGTAIPFAAGHTFSPANRTYTNQASSQSSQNYNVPATPLTISGNVRLGAIGLVGVHMTGLPGDPTTDTSGTFLVSVNYGWSGSVTPILSGYTFNPPSQTFTTITASQSISFTAATLVGPASRLVFTQSPNGGIGGAVWSTQPMVEIQDAIGNRVTSDNTTQVTLHIFDDPGHGWLDGTITITAVAGAASFAGLSIDKGGNGYTLQATSNTALDAATSIPFSIEGFMDAMNTLSVARQGLTATPTMLDGADLVLITGGRAGTSITALLDFFDPIAKTFAHPELAMIQRRTWHTATAMLDGRILIVGGEPDYISSYSAEIFDPANGECTLTPVGMDYPRSNHRATLLQDGRVLITGSSLTDEPVAEIYDPKTGTFAEAGLMNAARYLHTSTLLPNGRVLITGGNDNANDGAILSSAELYDPATGEFMEISGGMAGGPRANHQATLLDNGRVLITGGDEGPTSSAEIYDSPTDTYPNGHFTLIGNMLFVHKGHQAALLRDGTVLIIGGNDIGDGNEIYDPSSSIPFRATGPMSLDRTNGAVAILPDGKVLITGGYSNSGDGGGATDTAEIWIPRTPFPTHIVSGTITQGGVGVGGVMLVGLPGHPMTNAGGYYEGLVVGGWDGLVTPTKLGYAFSPSAYEYSDVISAMPNQNYFVTQAAAARLAFAQQPRNTIVNATMTPPITVEIQDELGNLVTTATDTVVLSLRNAGSAILGGTPSRAAVGGLATFGDLSIDTAGTGYLLRANSGSLTEVDSSVFNITALVLDHFDITPSPIGPQITNTPFHITITAKDPNGNVVTAYSGTNTLSLSFYPYTNISPANVTLSNGVWQGDVTITAAEYGVVISTSGGGKSGQSNAFDILYPGPYSTITGQVTYNGSPLLTDAHVNLSLYDKDAGRRYPIPSSSFNPANGTYVIPNVRSGTYEIMLMTDSHTPPNYQPDPGDFWGAPPSSFSVAAPTPSTQNFSVSRIIHLTSPFDNNPPGIPLPPPYPGHSSPVLFVWDPIPGAATYYIDVLMQDDTNYQDVELAFAESGIATTQKAINLPVSAADHYLFRVRAYNASLAVVGDFYVSLLQPGGGIYGFSGQYQFKVILGPPAQITVETAPDGTGVPVPAQNLLVGESITGYAISRTVGGDFVENVPADSWSLVNKTDGVVDGDLVVSGGGGSATFTGHLIGSAQIRAAKGGLTSVNSGTLTVTGGTGTNPEIWRSPIAMTFAGQEGGANPAIQTLQIKNTGGGTLSYDITSNAAWLSVSPANGNSTGEADIVNHSVLANIQGRPAGTYNAVLTIAATGASNTPQTASVTLTIAPPSPDEWTARYDFASAHGMDTPTDMAVDTSGNVIVVGESQGTTRDFLIIKYSNSGTKLWEQRYDNHLDDRAAAVAVDSAGDVYVTGDSEHTGAPPDNVDYVTIKCRGTDGGLIWQQHYNGTGDGADHAKALAVDPAGDYVYVTGTSAGPGGNTDYATIKYAGSDGSYRWPGPAYAMRYDGGADDMAVAVAADSSGNVYVTGSSAEGYTKIVTLRYDANGTQAWMQSYFSYTSAYAAALTLDNSGHLLVAGQSYTNPGKGLDLVVLKYDRANGNTVSPFPVYFDDNGAGNSAQVSSALVVDPGDHIYVVGSTEISYDTGYMRQSLAIKLNSAGDRLWARKYIGPSLNSTEALAVAVDGVGSVYASGYDLVGETEGIPDFITIKYDAAGNELWTRRYDGSVHGDDRVVALVLDSAGNVFVTGPSEGSGTSQDFCTIRYNPLGPPINTIAGTGTYGYNGDGIPATTAQISYPRGVAVGPDGSIYIADCSNNRIRKVDASGIITTFAGTGVGGFGGDGGPATSAMLRGIQHIALDSVGNLFIADGLNRRVRKVDPSGIITTVAGNGIADFSGDGGSATSASLRYPFGLAVDPSGNIYVSDMDDHRIRKIDPAGIITTFAGNGTAAYAGDGGPAISASLNSPHEAFSDAAGNVFIADTLNNRIRKVDLAGIITTVAGNGVYNYSGNGGLALEASFRRPEGVLVDSAGNILISDTYNNQIRKVDQATGIVFGIAGYGVGAGYTGDGGPAVETLLWWPSQLALDRQGNVFFAEEQNQRIRKVGIK